MKSTKNQEHIDAWKRENVLNLANHFHKYCTENNQHQHKRVHQFEMSITDVDIFKDLPKIKSIDIHLAINTGEDFNDEFRFYPILGIKFPDTDEVTYLPLEPKTRPNDGYQNDIVPRIFKEMILSNWNTIDNAIIDDLFIAQDIDSEDKSIDQMVRVHYFQIRDKMIDCINGLNGFVEPNVDENGPSIITGITLYPGVDMNKFGNKNLISFTPVLGFTHDEEPPNVLDGNGGIETAKKEIFIEYTFPCPPTCRVD